MSLKTIAVIPVHGRIPLLKHTIKRLYEKNRIDHVICVGDSDEERAICQITGAEFLKHPNRPLGRKWNYGFAHAKLSKPDAVLYVGSSDWVSDNWIKTLLPYVEYGYPIVGKKDFNLLHIAKELSVSWWPSYPAGSPRFSELIGIGRLLSRHFLDLINWSPFEDSFNDSMDGCMYYKLAGLLKDRLIHYPHEHNMHSIQSLSVSCELWSNMHTGDFNNAIPIGAGEEWLKIWFPEAFELKDELNESK